MEPRSAADAQQQAAADAATVVKHRCTAGPHRGGTSQAADDRALPRGAALPAAGPPTTGSHTHIVAAVAADAGYAAAASDD